MWPCSEGGARDGGCGHAVREGPGMKGITSLYKAINFLGGIYVSRPQ